MLSQVKPGRKPKAESAFIANASRLGQVVRDARASAEVTQAALASAAGVSPSWLAKLEQGQIGEPGLFPILAVLRELGVAVGDVLGTVMDA